MAHFLFELDKLQAIYAKLKMLKNFPMIPSQRWDISLKKKLIIDKLLLKSL